MKSTKFIGLKKPLTVEKYDVDIFNDNSDAIDSALSKLTSDLSADSKNINKRIDETNQTVKTNKADADNKIKEHKDNAEIHFTTTERQKLKGIESGAQVNTITGIKGNKETDYRLGKINLTPADLGADAEGSASQALKDAKNYTDAVAATKINLSQIDMPNGVAPLDANRKLPSANLSFGTTVGTCYEGSAGHKLQEDFETHITVSDANFKKLTRDIDAEITRATNSEAQITTRLTAETTRAREAEEGITNNLNTEITRAQAAEKTNGDAIASETTRAKAAEKANASAIAAETSRAKAVEKTNSDAIAAETSRAKAAEKVNTDAITAEISRANTAEKTNANAITSETSRAKAAEASITQTIQTNKPVWEDKYTKNEIDNKFSTLEMATDWKESVASFSNLASTYPNPQDGWTVNVKDTNITYRYDGKNWIAISANAIPKATQSVDGLLSKEDKKLYDDANSKKHTHSNKSVLDGITATLITAWNNAVAHITDTVKHITASERTKWNAVSEKVDKIETGAQVNKVTGIKGNAESAYRTGNVNLTPANIGAADSGHSHSNYASTVTTTGAGNAVTAITQSGNTLTAAKGTSFLPVTGGTLTGTMKVSYGASDTANTRFKQIEGSMAGSDKWGIASGASASDAGWMELYTEDNGNEPIYARQYTNTGTAAHQITLMDGSGNQALNKVTASGGFVGALSGNASTATRLQTARTINGTSFDGSGNITTANWGPSRNITIGNKQKSINGSADLSYSLSDIGAAASSHTHTKSQISDFPASLKNPNSLTIQSNGVTLAAYDGSAAKTANIPLMKAATASAAGSPGLVPAPAAGSQAAKYLRADGTWQTPTNTTYAVATETNDGLMSSKDKKLLGSTDISNIGNGTVTGAVAQLNSNLINNNFTNGFVQVAWLINKTVDYAGHINIGDESVYKYVLSVGIGSSIDPAIYVSKIFKNQYGLWYVKISQNNGSDYTNTAGAMNLGVLYLTV